MKVLTEINRDCSFLQTIIKLPQDRNDLISVGIDKNIADKLETYLQLIMDLQNLLSNFIHLKNFIDNAVEKNEVYYVKTFSEDNKDLSENREFICLGEYHRNLKTPQNLFLRIDQNWGEYNFPFESLNNFKKYFIILSGATIDTILPSIILEQERLNDISEILSIQNIQSTKFEKLFFFSLDYFGKSYFLNNTGEVFSLDLYGKTIENSQLDFKQWLDKELENIFQTKTD